MKQLEIGSASRLTIDGVEQPQMTIPMVKDGIVQVVQAWIARPT